MIPSINSQPALPANLWFWVVLCSWWVDIYLPFTSHATMEVCTLCEQENTTDGALLLAVSYSFVSSTKQIFLGILCTGVSRPNQNCYCYLYTEKYYKWSVKMCLIYACHGKTFYPKIPVIHKLTNLLVFVSEQRWERLVTSNPVAVHFPARLFPSPFIHF